MLNLAVDLLTNSCGRMPSWTEQTAFTSPGRHTSAVIAIGGEPKTIVSAIQGLLIHGGALEHYGVAPAAFSRETLPVEARLDELLTADPRPLTAPRLPQARAVGTCRDYATLVCSILRQNGEAARVRCGFAAYLGGAAWEDHWICEHWSGERWRRIDAQLDPVLQRALEIQMAADDLPSATFLAGDEAWRACRSGALRPDTLAHGDEAAGLWFVLVNLVRDHLALADRFTSSWDEWRATAADPAVLDVAILAAADKLAERRELAPVLETPWWIAS